MTDNTNETMQFRIPREKYLISGDPTYITSYNNARYLIRMLERDELLEELVRFYVNAPEHQDQSGMER